MNVTQSPLTVGNKQNLFMPIGIPEAPSDSSKWKSSHHSGHNNHHHNHHNNHNSHHNSPSPVPYGLAPPPQVIRPELLRPQQPPHPPPPPPPPQLHSMQHPQQQQQQLLPPQHMHVHHPPLHHPLPPPPIQTASSVGHATSVIRISPAAANNTGSNGTVTGNGGYQSFRPVIVDPSQLVPFLPPANIPTIAASVSAPLQQQQSQTQLHQQPASAQSSEKSMPKNGKFST